MIRGPGLDGGCQEHQRQMSILEAAAKPFGETTLRDVNDSLLDRPFQLGDPFFQRGDDGTEPGHEANG